MPATDACTADLCAWAQDVADYPNIGLLYRSKGQGRCAVCTAWPYSRNNKNYILTAGHCLQKGWTLKEVDWGKVGQKDKGVGTSQVTSSKCVVFAGDVLLCPVKSLPSGVTPFHLVPTKVSPDSASTPCCIVVVMSKLRGKLLTASEQRLTWCMNMC